MERMEKQTAVEWLVDCIESMDWKGIKTRKELYAKAKEMEKEQIEDAYIIGYTNCEVGIKCRNQYYNETFKSE